MKIHKRNQKGFTIIELMMATIVFSTVLLLIAVGILQFTRVFYKGVTESTLQETTRNTVDQIAQAIQFSGGKVELPSYSAMSQTYAFCVGNQQYTYYLGKQVRDNPSGPNQVYHTFVQNADVANCQTGATHPVINQAAINGQEMLIPKSRVARFSLTMPTQGTYRVSMRVVYGDDDLLCSPSLNATNCTDNSVLSNTDLQTRQDLQCKNRRAGTQFCAVSDVTTVVNKRVK